MAVTEVLLLKYIRTLGSEGDQVKKEKAAALRSRLSGFLSTAVGFPRRQDILRSGETFRRRTAFRGPKTSGKNGAYLSRLHGAQLG